MLHGQMLHGQMLHAQMLHGQLLLGHLSTVKDGGLQTHTPVSLEDILWIKTLFFCGRIPSDITDKFL